MVGAPFSRRVLALALLQLLAGHWPASASLALAPRTVVPRPLAPARLLRFALQPGRHVGPVKGGPLTIPAQGAVEPAPPVELTPEVTDFLKLAVPILTQYQDSHGQAATPEVPQFIARLKLWPFFLKQRDQILKDKWNSSCAAGYDLGMERAIREWLQRNYLVWAPGETGDEDDEETNGDNPTNPA
jgi:hypothetical protein